MTERSPLGELNRLKGRWSKKIVELEDGPFWILAMLFWLVFVCTVWMILVFPFALYLFYRNMVFIFDIIFRNKTDAY